MDVVARLWLPMVVSAVFVFLASSVIHMALKWHNREYRQLPDEDGVAAALRKAGAGPGQYVMPYCQDHKELGNPDMLKKFTDGPVALLWLRAPGKPSMGGPLAGWFVYNLVLAFFIAYLAGHVIQPGAHQYLQVFRVVGTVAFLAHGFGQVPNSIWMGKPWSATAKDLLDSLIYALLTAGAFGWLWPK